MFSKLKIQSYLEYFILDCILAGNAATLYDVCSNSIFTLQGQLTDLYPDDSDILKMTFKDVI